MLCIRLGTNRIALSLSCSKQGTLGCPSHSASYTPLIITAYLFVTAPIGALAFLPTVAVKENVVSIVEPVGQIHKHPAVLLVVELLAWVPVVVLGHTVTVCLFTHSNTPFKVLWLLPNYRAGAILCPV